MIEMFLSEKKGFKLRLDAQHSLWLKVQVCL